MPAWCGFPIEWVRKGAIIDNLFEPHEGDSFELQKLRAIGSGYAAQLAAAGAAVEEIAKIRASLQPMFNSPLITVPHTIHAAPDSVRGFAYARYLVEHYNEPQSDGWKQIRAALQLLEDRPLTASGLALSANNRAKAKKGRGKKEKIGIVAAVRKANPGETAKELWPRLKAYLTDQNMEPEETEKAINYRADDDVQHSISFRNFQRLLTEVNKKSP